MISGVVVFTRAPHPQPLLSSTNLCWREKSFPPFRSKKIGQGEYRTFDLERLEQAYYISASMVLFLKPKVASTTTVSLVVDATFGFAITAVQC